MPRRRNSVRAISSDVRHPQEDLLTVADVAKMFGVTQSTVYQWVTKEWIKSYKVPQRKTETPKPPGERNTKVYFTKQDCIAWGRVWYQLGNNEPSEQELKDAVADLG